MYYTINDLQVIAVTGAMNTDLDSLESIIIGTEIGATGYNLDIDLTKDGLPVLCKNGHYDLPENQRIYVNEHDYHELRQYFKKTVTIGQAIQLIKSSGAVLAINMKNKRPLAAIKTILVHDEHLERSFITGFTTAEVTEFKTRYPQLNFMAKVEKIDADLMASVLAAVKKSGAEGLQVTNSLITKELCEAAHNLGLLVASFETNDSDEIANFVKIGVNFIYTKSPNIAVEFLPEEEATVE